MGVTVSYNDPPIHCVDISDSLGQRWIRIRPKEGGAIFTCDDSPAVFVARPDLATLASALERMAR